MLEVNDFAMKQVVFLFSTLSDKISFHNDNVIITDKQGKIKYQITCYRVFALFIIGDTTITSGIIRRAHKYGFAIYLFTQSFKLYAIIGNRMEGNTLLHRKQYAYNSDELANFLVYNKILNQKNTLSLIRKKTPACKDAIALLEDNILLLEAGFKDSRSLLGIEGNAARIYFKEIFNSVAWLGRKPRIKSDWVNASLDIGYSLLFNMIDSLLQVYGFDAYCGVYHKDFYLRKSLVCDIMEPIRPLIDYRLRKAINLEELTQEDFKEYNKQFLLKYDKNAKAIEIFMQPIMERKEDIFKYIRGYYRNFMKGRDISAYSLFEV